MTSHSGEVLRRTIDRGVRDTSDRSTPPSDHSHPTARTLIMEREFNTVKMSCLFPPVTRCRSRCDVIGGERVTALGTDHATARPPARSPPQVSASGHRLRPGRAGRPACPSRDPGRAGAERGPVLPDLVRITTENDEAARIALEGARTVGLPRVARAAGPGDRAAARVSQRHLRGVDGRRARRSGRVPTCPVDGGVHVCRPPASPAAARSRSRPLSRIPPVDQRRYRGGRRWDHARTRHGAGAARTGTSHRRRRGSR